MEGCITDESNPNKEAGAGDLGEDEERVWVGRDVVGDATEEADDEKAIAVKAEAEEAAVGLPKVVRTGGRIESSDEEKLESKVEEEERLGEVQHGMAKKIQQEARSGWGIKEEGGDDVWWGVKALIKTE